METKSKYKQISTRFLVVLSEVLPSLFLGAAIALSMAIFFMSSYIETGLGTFFNLLISCILVVSPIVVVGYAGKCIAYIFHKLPQRVFSYLGVILAFSVVPGIAEISSYLGIIGAVIGAVIYILTKKNVRKRTSILLLVLSAGLVFFIVSQLYSDGNTNYTHFQKGYYKSLSAGNLQDPSAEGQYKYKYLTYGSGSDKRRAEFSSSVSLKTMPFDASAFIDSSGIQESIRRKFWGFNSSEYPLNARVWYPEGTGKFPLVLIVHGNHRMEEFSDPGYEYLGQHLASRGNIVVSVDENFLNRTSIFDYGQEENIVRGILLLEHLKCWTEWNKSPGNIFYNKLDTTNIFLAGHSRGGEAVAIASTINRVKKFNKNGNISFDYNFIIKGIIQIAPTDSYEPTKGKALVVKDVNYLLIQGGFDADEYVPKGYKTFNRLAFSDSSHFFKSTIYSYRSNHSQFNTTWGRYDFGYPINRLLNVKPILPAKEQRKIAKIYISAFIETVTQKRPEYQKIFKDFRLALPWLPEDYFSSLYEESQLITIANFEEDNEPTIANTVSISGRYLSKWVEQEQLMRDNQSTVFDNSVVYLGWDRNSIDGNESIPEYTLEWDSSFASINSTLRFDLAIVEANGFDVPDLTIRLQMKNGKDVDVLMSEIGQINPRLNVMLYKWGFLNERGTTKRNHSHQLQRFVIEPDLIRTKSGLAAFKVIKASFLFNKTKKGEIILDNIGWVSEN